MAASPAGEFFEEVRSYSRSYFVDEVTKTNSVRLRHGELFTLDYLICERSPVLRNKSVNDPDFFTVDCTAETMEQLVEAHRKKIMPDDDVDVFNLLAATEALQLEELRNECLKNIFRVTWDGQYEEEYPTGAILSCFEKLMESPFRTKEVFLDEVERVNKHIRNLDLVMYVPRALEPKFKEYENLGLDRLPVPFDEEMVHFVIACDPRNPTKLETGIFYREEYTKANLLGNNFDLSANRKIDGVHLKWGSYLLYLQNGSVYRQDIRRTEGVKLMDNCVSFISIEGEAFIVTREDSRDSVWHWVEDSVHGHGFEAIYVRPAPIVSVDFDPNSNDLLIAEKSGLYSYLKLRAGKWISMGHFPPICDPCCLLWVMFVDDHFLARISTSKSGKPVEEFRALDTPYHRVDTLPKWLSDESEYERFESFCRDGAAVFLRCGEILKRAPTPLGELRAYEKYSTDGEKAMLGSVLHLCSSEVRLLP